MKSASRGVATAGPLGKGSTGRIAMRPSPAAVAAPVLFAMAWAGGVLAAAPDGEGVLDVVAGSLTGSLAEAPAGAGPRETLLWKSPLFATPFEFPLDRINGATFPVPPVPPAADALRLHLRGGDVLTGRITGMDATHVTIVRAADAAAALRIDRTEIESIARAGAGGGSFTGPGGLLGWSESPPGSWREEAGRILSSRRSAAVIRDVAAPPRARFDITLSWKAAAEFRIAVAAAESPAADPYVLELLQPADDEPGLALARREPGAAAIQPLALGPRQGNSLRVVVFVDQSRGRLAAVVPGAGGEATEVELPVPQRRAASGAFRLTLTSGDVCLESLRVTPWQAEEPTLDEAPETAIMTGTTRMRGVAVEAFDVDAAAFVVRGPTGAVRVPVADVQEIVLPTAGAQAEPPAALRVIARDGDVVSGDLLAVDAEAIRLGRRGVDGPIAVPRAALVALRGQRPPAAAGDPPGRVGMLVAPADAAAGGKTACAVRGCVVAGPDGTGVAWQPLGSLRGSVFATADGPPAAVVEYVPRPRGQPRNEVEVGGIGGMVNLDPAGFFVVVMMTEDGAASRDGRLRPGDRIEAIRPEAESRFVPTQNLDNEQVMNLLRGRVGTSVALRVTGNDGGDPREIELERRSISVAGRNVLEQALAVHDALGGPPGTVADPARPFPALVILRSGDVAACRVHAIDAAGVVLETPLVAAPGRVKVAAELVQAVELVPAARSRDIDEVLFNRLLTLPRMQRARPPTHLLRLADGDYLRGRLESLDDTTVRFEVLGTRKELPRSLVARVIWLHPEADEPAAPRPAASGLIVQGVSADGGRVTLEAEAVAGDTIRGRSRAFGTGTIDVSRMDRLLFGPAVGSDAGERPYRQWKLRPAAEPRALEAGGKQPREGENEQDGT
jgi:hypothetical protein